MRRFVPYLALETATVLSGTAGGITMVAFPWLVLKVTGSKSVISHEPLPVDDPKQRRPDITKASRLLGWEPVVDLEFGLRLSMPYFQEAVKLGAAGAQGAEEWIAA